MENVKNSISAKQTKQKNKEMWMSTMDLKWFHWQSPVNEEIGKRCILVSTALKLNIYYRFYKKSLRIGLNTDIFPGKNQQLTILFNSYLARWQ